LVKHINTLLFVLAGWGVASATHAESASIYTRNGNEFALTGSSYLYEEPSLNVSTTGDKFGMNHTGTLLLNSDWFLKEDVRFAYGQVDYAGSGMQLGVPDWYGEVRGLLGRDVQVRSVVLSPYVGFGYRYLFNDLRGYSSTGSAGYRRESNYYYLPLGVTHRMEMQDQAVLSTTVEFDYLLWGVQLTRLSDLIGHNGVISASDTSNRQHSGYGLRLNMMYEMSDWGFGPFIHYWNIGDSEVTTQVMTDAFGPSMVRLQEPKNQTTEYGIRVMFRF
jgi:hypothetical protein